MWTKEKLIVYGRDWLTNYTQSDLVRDFYDNMQPTIYAYKTETQLLVTYMCPW